MFEFSFFKRWIQRRIPPARRIVMDYNKIFVFPTPQGLLFCCMLLVLLIGSINYSNSMGFALCFWLASLFILSILYTFGNLSGLVVEAGKGLPVYAGQTTSFSIYFYKEQKRNHESIYTGWDKDQLKVLNLVEDESVNTQLMVKTKHRGIYKPGRLLIESVFPLGIIRSWSWLDLDLSVLVYPQPIENHLLDKHLSRMDAGEMVQMGGQQDFYGLKDYRPGDSLRNAAWKVYARENRLYSKTFVDHVTDTTWIDWDQFGECDVELKLSYMTYWVIKLTEAGYEFGLKLPDVNIPPANNEGHTLKCLEVLAVF